VRDGSLLTLPLESPTNFDVEIYENRISTVGQVLIRRNVLTTLTPIFDSKMVPCDDWDLYLRLSQIGDLVFVPKLILDRRIHEKNVSSNDAVMKQSENYIRNTYASSKTLSARNKKLARESYRMWAKRILQFRLRWAGECMKERRFLESAKQFRHAALMYAKVIGPLR
jgi:GT2 family glycosyltransferase